MQDRPTAAELITTLAEYLEDEVMPALEGPLGYRTRVAANLLRILERENALGLAALLRERELLAGLLEEDASAASADAVETEVGELNRRVAEAIAAGRIEHARAWPVLMELARAKLAIIRPGYESWDSSVELP